MINYVAEHNYRSFLSFFMILAKGNRFLLIISEFQIGGVILTTLGEQLLYCNDYKRCETSKVFFHSHAF